MQEIIVKSRGVRSPFLKAIDNMNERDKWLVKYAAKWLLLFLVIVLYTLIVARVSYAKAERVFEDWKVEYADGYVQHMETVQENMPLDKEQMERIEMMQEYWRKHK